MSAPTKEQATDCRACGAVMARPGHFGYGICLNCEERFLSYRRGKFNGVTKISHDDATIEDWLLLKLRRNLSKANAQDYRPRCEAISTGIGNTNHGFQCAATSKHVRDGRHVCSTHNRVESVVFCAESGGGEEEVFAKRIAFLCDRNPALLTAIRGELGI